MNKLVVVLPCIAMMLTGCNMIESLTGKAAPEPVSDFKSVPDTASTQPAESQPELSPQQDEDFDSQTITQEEELDPVTVLEKLEEIERKRDEAEYAREQLRLELEKGNDRLQSSAEEIARLEEEVERLEQMAGEL